MSANVQKGDIWGAFDITSNGEIFAHPGEHTPTRVEWILKGIDQLRIKSVNTVCNQGDSVLVEIAGPDLPSMHVTIPKGGEKLIDVRPWEGKVSTLTISKNQNSGCDGLNITGE
jgi:hypothetical protein